MFGGETKAIDPEIQGFARRCGQVRARTPALPQGCAQHTTPPTRELPSPLQDGTRVQDSLRSRRSLARTCSQETVFTTPESSSCKRRSTSLSHVDSTSVSCSLSRLSINRPASVARSLSGKSEARLKSLTTSFVITKSYHTCGKSRELECLKRPLLHRAIPLTSCSHGVVSVDSSF